MREIPWIVGVDPSRTFDRQEKVRVLASASATTAIVGALIALVAVIFLGSQVGSC
jgi:hypothetical protein